jgi:hypothetical protein
MDIKLIERALPFYYVEYIMGKGDVFRKRMATFCSQTSEKDVLVDFNGYSSVDPGSIAAVARSASNLNNTQRYVRIVAENDKLADSIERTGLSKVGHLVIHRNIGDFVSQCPMSDIVMKAIKTINPRRNKEEVTVDSFFYLSDTVKSLLRC